MPDEFKKGDKVKWKSHGGEAHGTFEKKQTSPPLSRATRLPPPPTIRSSS
jgi:hypothetical protein